MFVSVDNRRFHEDSRHYDSHEAEKAMLGLTLRHVWQIMGIMDSGMHNNMHDTAQAGGVLSAQHGLLIRAQGLSEPQAAVYRSRA